MSSLLLLLIACGSPDTGEETGKDPGPKDADGDGYKSSVDCDDGDADVHPEQEDGCDDVDNDCDGETDEDADLLWYPDADGDGWGNEGSEAVASCKEPADHVNNHRDCDDTNGDIWPGQSEACNNIDDDCDGEIDEGMGDLVTVWPDEDGDGAGDATASPETGCEGVVSGVTNAYDCDDADPDEPVFADPSASSGDGSIDHPFDTLQKAINASSTCVRAYPGVYEEDVATVGRDVDIAALESSASTTLRGRGGTSVLYVGSGEYVRFAGFTVTGGAGYLDSSYSYNGDGTYTYYYQARGGGAYIYASIVDFEDVVFEDNAVYRYSYSYDSYGNYYYYTGFGGAIYAYSSTVSLTGAVVRGSAAYLGGAIYADYADLELSQVEVLGNVADYYAGVLSNSANLTMTNVIGNGNDDTGNYGFLTCDGCTATLTNVSLVDNPTQVYAGYGSRVTVQNSALQGGTYGIMATSGATVTVRYSNVYNHSSGNYSGLGDQTGSNGNISVSSGFVDFNNDGDPTNDDLELGGSSTLVDAGDPAVGFNDGDGTRNDMGAFGGPAGSW